MSEPLPRLAIACQGGGAHTAFTAGALSYLLLAFEHFRRQPGGRVPFQLTGLSGTSGGAITAAMAWSDPGAGGWAEGAQRVLRFWNRNKASLQFQDKDPWWWGEFFTNASARWLANFEDFGPTVSWPPNPLTSTLTQDRMRTDIRAALDLPPEADAIRGRAGVDLYVGAVDVINRDAVSPGSAFRTFPATAGDALHVDELLASACIPELFFAQKLKIRSGRHRESYFWDGLYSQNPPLTNFFCNREAEDKPDLVWIVQINPSSYSGRAPMTPSQIDDRRNELAGNLSLGQELRSIATVNQIAAELDALRAQLPADDAALRAPLFSRYKTVTVAFLPLANEDDSGRPLAAYTLDHASKMNRDPAFIDALIAEGIATAHTLAHAGQLVRPACMTGERHARHFPNPSWPAPAELVPLLNDPVLAAQWRALAAGIA
ncbi:MAG TPA: patatin-like phospholipase family protein [Rhodocyclaceae bacterium]|nr:patatin-like phospholipase family protein [Rhodocyclaceae bacterium]